MVYPFMERKLGKIQVLHHTSQGFQRSNLQTILGSQVIERFSNTPVYTKRGLILDYYRVCTTNSTQIPRTKLGAGSRRSVTLTRPGLGLSRLPRAKLPYGKVVSNIPSARGGRLYQRLQKNQTPLRMNKKQRRNARQSILWALLRQSRIYVVQNQLFNHKNKPLKEVMAQDPFLCRYALGKDTDMPVLICRSQEGKPKGASFLAGSLLLDQYHHSLYDGYRGGRRRSWILASREGLVDLLTRVYL